MLGRTPFTEIDICCVDSVTVGDIVSINMLSGGSWLEVIRVFCVIVFGSPFSSTIVILNEAYSSIARSYGTCCDIKNPLLF